MDRIYVTIVKNDENIIEIEHLVGMKTTKVPDYIDIVRNIQTNVNGVLTNLVDSETIQFLGVDIDNVGDEDSSGESDDNEDEQPCTAKRKSPSSMEIKKRRKFIH